MDSYTAYLIGYQLYHDYYSPYRLPFNAQHREIFWNALFGWIEAEKYNAKRDHGYVYLG